MLQEIFTNRRVKVVVVAIFTGVFSGAGHVGAETLGGAVEKVLRGHPEAKMAKAQADVAHYEAEEIRGSLLPRLSVGATMGQSYRDRDVGGLVNSGEWLNQSQGNLNVRQRIFQRGLALNDTKAAQRRAKAARLMAADVDQQLALMVVESYLGILRGQEQVALARENVLIHEETLSKTEARKDAGRATQADIELVKARLGLSRSSVETRKVLLENARVRYRALVEEEPENLQEIPRLGGGDIPSWAGDANISGNPALKATIENYHAAKHQSEAGKGLLWPLIELEMGGGLGDDVGGVRGQDNEAHAFLVASWDIWEGGARRAQKKQRETREKAALNEILSMQLQVGEALGSAIADRNGALLTEKQLSRYAVAMGQVVGAYEKQVEVGSRAMLNLLDVKNESFRAHSARVDSEFASLMAGYQVIAATGRIVEVLAPNVDGGEEGGKRVFSGSERNEDWSFPADKTAVVVADRGFDVGEDNKHKVRKKSLLARMFMRKKKEGVERSEDNEAHGAGNTIVVLREQPVPSKTATTVLRGSTVIKEKPGYSWSAISPETSRMGKRRLVSRGR